MTGKYKVGDWVYVPGSVNPHEIRRVWPDGGVVIGTPRDVYAESEVSKEQPVDRLAGYKVEAQQWFAGIMAEVHGDKAALRGYITRYTADVAGMGMTANIYTTALVITMLCEEWMGRE